MLDRGSVKINKLIAMLNYILPASSQYSISLQPETAMFNGYRNETLALNGVSYTELVDCLMS